jgi:hypothetical protein
VWWEMTSFRWSLLHSVVLRVSGAASVVLAMLSAENETMKDCSGEDEMGPKALDCPGLICFRTDPPQLARRTRRLPL